MSFTYSDPNINVNNANLVIAGASNKLRTPKVEFTDGTFLTSGLGVTNNLELIASIGNVTSNTLQFNNPTTAFITGADSNVGIGLSNPERLLHVGSRTTGGQIRLSTYAPNNGDQTLTSNLSILSLTGGRTDGNGDLAAVQENDILGQIALSGANGPNGYNAGFRIRSTATGDWADINLRRCETIFTQRTGDGISDSSFTEIMKISSEGDIGIGTSTPTYPLHVYGNTAIAIENDGQPRIDFLSSQFGSGPGANVNLLVHKIGASGDNFGNCFSIRRTGTGIGKINISMEDDTVEMLNLKSNNVGVGTMTPATRLHVSGTTDVDATHCTLRIEDTDSTTDSAKPKLEFYGAGTQMYSISGESQLSGENFLLFSDSSGNPSMALNSAMDLIKVDGNLPNDLGQFSEGIQIRATSSSASSMSMICYDNTNIYNSARMVFRRTSSGTVNNYTDDLVDDTRLGFISWNGKVGSSDTYFSMIESKVVTDNGGKLIFHTRPNGGSLTSRMIITDTGNVAIGTTTDPVNPLDVTVTVPINIGGPEANSFPIASFRALQTGGSPERGLEIGAPPGGISDAPVYLKVRGTSARFCILNQSNVENFTILDNGNVGMGIIDPQCRLSVQSAAAGNVVKMFDTGTNGGAMYNGAPVLDISRKSNGTNSQEGPIFRVGRDVTSNLEFNVSNTHFVVNGFNGNVGIGTDNPTEKLVVSGSLRINFNPGNGYVYFHDDTINANMFYIQPAIFTGSAPFNNNILNCINSSGFQVNTGGLNRLDIDSTGAVTISGSLSKGSGSFKIDHPLKETHHLVHSFVESPQANNIYRGKVKLENGQAIVNLDEVSTMTEGTFVLLNRDIHVYTTNETDWDAVRGRVEGNLLTIECQNTGSTATVSWLVIGERQDKHMYETSWTDENGKVIVEPLKTKNDNNENAGTAE